MQAGNFKRDMSCSKIYYQWEYFLSSPVCSFDHSGNLS